MKTSASSAWSQFITLSAQGLLRGPGSSPEKRQWMLLQHAGQTKRSCVKKEAGTVLFWCHHPPWQYDIHTAQGTISLKSLGWKCCCICHTFQTWYLQTSVFWASQKVFCCRSNQLDPCTWFGFFHWRLWCTSCSLEQMPLEVVSMLKSSVHVCVVYVNKICSYYYMHCHSASLYF